MTRRSRNSLNKLQTKRRDYWPFSSSRQSRYGTCASTASLRNGRLVPFSLRTRLSLAPFPHTGCFRHRANTSSLHAIYHGSWTTRTTSWGFRAPRPHAPRGIRGSAFRVPCRIFWRSQKPTELDLTRTELVELARIFSSRCVPRSRVVIRCA
jgi:hypothetical protein